MEGSSGLADVFKLPKGKVTKRSHGEINKVLIEKGDRERHENSYRVLTCPDELTGGE